MAQTQILNLNSLLSDNMPFPTFGKPLTIGFFSLSTDREYIDSAEELRYYISPDLKKLPLDLNIGYHKAKKKDENAYNEKLDNMLRFIVQNQQICSHLNSCGKRVLDAEFVCWRGLLRLIMCTPYENKEDWHINITRYSNTFYLFKQDTLKDKFERKNCTQRQIRMSAWGFKFEQYCLSESPSEKPDVESPVDECSEFVSVFKTKIGENKLLYGAEMDGVISETTLDVTKIRPDALNFVELKTNIFNPNKHQSENFKRFKSKNWWCQSFLVGIERIIVGLRDDQGLVQAIEKIDVSTLPRQGGKYWKATVCSNFLLLFLDYVRNVMADVDCPYTTYVFHFHSLQNIVSYTPYNSASEHSFLPDWYTNGFNQFN